MNLDRRDFLTAGLGGLASMALVPASRLLAFGGLPGSGGTSSQKVVVANMRGGWDTVNVIVPYGTTQYALRRPTIAIPAPDPLNPDAALPLEPSIGLHPALAAIHPRYAAGEMAVVQKVGYPNPSLSHFTSQDIMSRGLTNLMNPDSRGWLGRLGDHYFNQALQIVGLRTGNKIDFRASSAAPVAIDDLASFTVPGNPFDPGDSELRNDITQQVLDAAGTPGGLLGAVRDSNRSVFDLVEQVAAAVASYSSTVTYPDSSFAASLQDAARLIQGQLPTQLFYVQRGGFDTHSNEVDGLGGRLVDVGDSLAAFIADLQAMNEWANTTIILISEFGRRNYENGSAGTDHGRALHFILLGGSVLGGLKGTNVTDADLLQDTLTMEIDFRQVYSDVLQNRFAIDPTPIFPGWVHPGTPLNLF